MGNDDDADNVDGLYAQCRRAMNSVETQATQVKQILMNAFKIKVDKNTRAYVFSSDEKSLSPEFKKDTVTSILSALSKIITSSHNSDDIIASLGDVNKAACKQLANTIIEEIKNNEQSKYKAPVVSYAKATSPDKIPETKVQHTLLVNSKDVSNVYGEIKNKIKLKEKNIKLAREPFVKNKTTLIMNFADEEGLQSMQREINNLKLPDTSTKHLKKFSPTIRIFDVGDKTDEEISNTIEEITGHKPLLVSSRTSNISGKRNVIVRLAKEQYYDLIKLSPTRLMIEYSSFRYEKYIAVRFCKKCNGIGHSDEHCRLDDKFKQVVETCIKKKVCGSCVLKELDRILVTENNFEKALEIVFASVTHRVFGISCTEYAKQINFLEKKYDF